MTPLPRGTGGDSPGRRARFRGNPRAASARPDEDERGALDRLGRDLAGDVAERAAQDALVGPARAHDHGDRTVGAVERRELFDDPLDRRDREMDDERRAGGREGCEPFVRRHGARRGRACA